MNLVSCSRCNCSTDNPVSDGWREVDGWLVCDECVKEEIPSKEMQEFTYEKVGKEVGQLVDDKQKQYGDSFGRSERIMNELYPNGIKPYQMTDALAVVRILDKLFRIAQRGEDGLDLGGESPYRDIAGYGLLGYVKDESSKFGKE